MPSRSPLVVGNWKMHKTVRETVAYIESLRELPLPSQPVDAVICPPFTALAAAHNVLRDLGIDVGLGAQNMNWASEGAFTGEISPKMLVELGVRWVVLGHSERRAMFGELDERINEKVRAALEFGLTPIVAVGETDAEHKLGITQDRVHEQIVAAFAGISEQQRAQCVVAYEPIWAIGSGVADSPESADAVMGFIRGSVPGLEDVRILYGGSVKPDNIASFVAKPNIDGGLVGGASLDPHSFVALLAGACKGIAA